ncbi:flavin monoamine oxidase family protein [Leptolyngbya sp. NK1-12]|uniref:Flavin monoamine oxidase family protein n=1 Tax=Leptolyngbya sp. NK1-12 TaxID=2547451 RepID=A0AA96WB55_9CYAN|nr:flavin monoamine oxidase family protein [Leptolyngbya sp. NK1-12]WNZ21923.1 flavin monoamine oxidase family protein [Leptolyngbya sp. NK1-12]
MMHQTEMLATIEAGLQPGNSRPKKIVIVGAGMAGLVAGDLLKRAGHKITILEAQHRVGGRIYTVRDGLAPGLRAEMGAMRIPQSHELTMAYVRRFRLKTEPFIVTNPNAYIYLQGKRVRRKEFDPQKFVFDVHPHESGKHPEDLLKATFKPIYDRVLEQGEAVWDQIIAEYDHFSLRGFLRHSGWSEGAIEMLGILGNVESRMNSSFVSYLHHEYSNTFSNMVYLVDGSDALPNAFLPILGKHIRLGASLEAIDNAANQVTVTYQTLAGQFQETADYLIVTIPFSLMRHIEVTPAFSPRKRRAIRQLNYDSSSKIFMQCSSRFWENDDGIHGGGSVTDLAIRNVFYPQHGQETGRGALLASYTWGRDAICFASLPRDYLIRQAIENLREIHPQIDRTFEVAVYHHWGNDPYAGGVGALLEPGTMSSFNDIVAPEGRVYFAGDHCSKFKTRWIQGAIESAIHAAQDVHAAR